MAHEGKASIADSNRPRFFVRVIILAGIILAVLTVAPARAQSLEGISGDGPSKDRSAILDVLHEYLRVTDEQDERSIAKAFHPVATLMSVTGAGEVVGMSQATWWSRVSKIPGGRIIRSSVVRFIDVTGSAAIARIDITSGGRTSTDYFNLLRARDGWRIVNKTLSTPIG
jgi:hypothetical protein